MASIIIKLLLALSLCTGTWCFAKAPRTDPPLEKWQLLDGSSHEARLLYFTDKEDKNKKQVIIAMMAGADDLIKEYPFARFSKASKDILTKRRLHFAVRSYNAKMPYTFPPTPGTGWQYAGSGTAKRTSIPSYNQTDYGYKAGSCVPNSFVNTLAWWDANKMITLPQKRTAHKQIDWLHTIISREAKTRNSGTTWTDLISGVKDFTEKSLKGEYRMPCFPVRDVTPKILARFTQQNWAVCLSVDTYSKNKHTGGHGVTLVAADENGNVKLNTWGLHIEGKLKPIETKKRNERWAKGKSYEIIIKNRELLPDWFQRDEIRFKIESNSWAKCYVFLPMEKQLAGKKWQPTPKTIVVGDLLGIKKPNLKPVVKKPKPASSYEIHNPNEVRIHRVDMSVLKVIKVGHEIIKGPDGKKTATLLAVADEGIIQRFAVDDIFEKSRSIFTRYQCAGANTNEGHLKNYYKSLTTPDIGTSKHFDRIAGRFPPKPILGWMHKEPGGIDRNKFPDLQPSSYGKKNGPSVQNAIVNTLIWWHRNGIIKLPEVESEKKLCAILHKFLTPKHTSAASTRHWEHAALQLYLLGLKSMKASSAFVCYGDTYNMLGKEYYPKTLKKVLHRHYGVILAVSLCTEKHKPYAQHAMPVLDISPTGIATVSSWGVKLKGRFTDYETRGTNGYYQKIVTFEIINSEALPKWFKDKKLNLEIHKQDGIKVIIPYTPVKAGQQWTKTPEAQQ